MAPAEAKLSGGIWPDGRKAVYLRMKQPVILFALLIALAAASCGRSDTSRRLDAASELMCDHPDSALSILAAIDTATLSRDARARHALYTICARHKSGEEIDSTFDNLFDLSNVMYFSGKERGNDAMYLNYFNGLRRFSNKEYSTGIVQLLKAEEIAAENADSLQLGLIYRYIADAYRALYSHNSAVHYSEKSLECFRGAGADKYIPYALNDFAICLNNANLRDSAAIVALEAAGLGLVNGDSMLYADAMSTAAMAYTALHKYKEVKKVLLQVDSLGVHYIIPSDYSNLGLAYLKTGDMNRAERIQYILDSINCNDHSLACSIYKAKKDYKKAFDALSSEFWYQDSIMGRVTRQNTEIELSEFYNTEKDLYRQLTIEHSRINALRIVVCLLIMAILLISIAWMYRRNIRKQSNFMSELECLQAFIETSEHKHNEQIAQLSSNLDEARNNIKKAFAIQSSNLNDIINAYYVATGSKTEMKRVYKQAVDIIEKLRSDTNHLKNIEKSINEYLDNLIVHIRTDFPWISGEEVRLYMYFVIGLTPQAIGVIIGKSTQNVYLRKSRLIDKMRLYNPERAEYYKSFI